MFRHPKGGGGSKTLYTLKPTGVGGGGGPPKKLSR